MNSRNLTASPGLLTNPLRYTAREFDSETGLYFYRARFYDSQIGRFFSEDPVGFEAGPNFYRYVRNNPVLLIDPTGLITTFPPDPRLNTVVCNGRGGMRAQIGSPGSPEEANCVGDCLRVHEESHLADNMASNPKICRGKAKGVVVGFSNEEEQIAGEIKASDAELDCLRKLLESGCKGKACALIILDRVAEVEGYRNGFQKKKK